MKYIIDQFVNLQEVLIAIILVLLIYYLINIGNKYIEKDKRFSISRKNIYIFSLLMVLVIMIYNILNNRNVIRDIINLLFYSLIFSYSLNPIVNFLERKGIKRTLAILLVYISIVCIGALVLFLFVPEITREFDNLIDIIPNHISKIDRSINNMYLKYAEHIESLPSSLNGINTIFKECLEKTEIYLLEFIRKSAKHIMNSLMSCFKLSIIPVISFYFLKDKDLFKAKLLNIIPRKYKKNILDIARDIDISLISFLRGQILTSAIVGGLSIIALCLVNIEFAILIGIVIAIFEIVPYLGPLVGISLTLMFGLLDSPSKAITGVIVLLIIQQLENSIIAPRIIGKSVGINPVIIIIAVIVGASYFGLIGMILAVPLVSIIKILSLFVLDKAL